MNEIIMQKLIDQAREDVKELSELLEEYRKDKGIGISLFIEILATATQNFRLMKTVFDK